MPDGQRFLSGGEDRDVRVWLLNGTLKDTFSELHTGSVRALVAMPDNLHALSGSHDKTVKLFNVSDGAALRTFRHDDPFTPHKVFSLALMPDGRRFVEGYPGGARIVEHGLAPR